MGLNSTSVVILEDFVKGCCGMKPSDRCSTIIAKSLVVLLSLVALSFVFLIEKLGGILAVSISMPLISCYSSVLKYTILQFR